VACAAIAVWPSLETETIVGLPARDRARSAARLHLRQGAILGAEPGLCAVRWHRTADFARAPVVLLTLPGRDRILRRGGEREI